MPKKSGGQKKRPSKRELRLQVRVKQSEKERFEAAAIQADETVSEWVIKACEQRIARDSQST